MLRTEDRRRPTIEALHPDAVVFLDDEWTGTTRREMAGITPDLLHLNLLDAENDPILIRHLLRALRPDVVAHQLEAPHVDEEGVQAIALTVVTVEVGALRGVGVQVGRAIVVGDSLQHPRPKRVERV